MSAMRMSLLAAAALSGALAPTAECWAQAYGAKSVVEHNDLRWFEPVELDIDGQMPHRDAGWFFSADKLYWAIGNPKTEIGTPGLVVDSERIYPSTPVPIAQSLLEQVQNFDFIDSAAEALAYSGVDFARVVVNDPSIRRDDQEFNLGLNLVSPTNPIVNDLTRLNFAFRATNRYGRTVPDPTSSDPDRVRFVMNIENVADLNAALEQLRMGGWQLLNGTVTDVVNNSTGAAGADGLADDTNNDGVADQGVLDTTGQDAINVRVAGEPQPYGVSNGIRDALPDAGFAWGERYEFGYSDGEHGWMLTVLDGPEATAGGVYGAGEGTPYFSQSGTSIPGHDPYFDNNGEDDDQDGRFDGDGEAGAVDIYALGFGSVPVNFTLPNPDFLTGFRDYNDGNTPWTTTGPIMYVGNYGAVFTELIVNSINLGNGVAGVDELNQAFGAAAGNGFNSGSTQLTALTAALTTFSSQNPSLATQVANAQTIVNLLNTGTFPAGGFADQAAAVAALGDAFTTLTAVATIGGQNQQTVTPNNVDRQADDLNGNGNPGVINVIGLVNGVATVIGQVIDYGDKHDFNVFFDQVTVRNRTEMDGVELMRMHELSTRHHLEQGRWDNMRLTYGVRFLSLKDDFYFQGIGSILGRTTVSTDVENQVVGPQIGITWTRNDGPWSFDLEARGTAGYNIVDVDQNGIFGEELIPGALNRPAVARTTTSVDSYRFNEFSPLGELRAQLRYRLAESVSLQVGYTAKYIGNVHRGGNSTAWNAPDFGVHDYKGDIFINGLNVGFELRH